MSDIRKTKVSTLWLYDWIKAHSGKDYITNPILEGIQTREQALNYLERIIEKGVFWLE